MWNRNLDTGKWFQQTDTLPKEIYENLKIDLEKVKLYSKCLSGATYLTINDFDNLYPELSQEKIGFYFDDQPNNGPRERITDLNSDEFYNKYLAEDAFTIKNLFTPEKLIGSEGKNLITVDISTTEYFDFKTGSKIIIDGVQLINGHKVLVKDQKKQKVLSFNQNPVDYFKNDLIVSSYSLIVDNGSTQTYEYYDSENGIYEYDGNRLNKLNYLSDYYKSKKFIVSVKLGEINSDKQFHLLRLLNGYFPIDGDNVQFQEKTNWVLRNRVDYNNIYDLNFYDVIRHGPQIFFDEISSKTYSIPERTITVGEFGSIINNQNKYYTTSTYSISNIISNKYKVNLRSIEEVEKYYWTCGDEGVLLKISKSDLNVEKIELYENLNLTSVSFTNNLYGVVVGKFNTIYFTRDGGVTWVKINFDEFEKYSYLSVKHIDINNFIVSGENGLLIEFSFSSGNWYAYKRNVKKFLGQYDEYSLVEDINDLDQTDWVNIKPFSFSAGLGFDGILGNGYDLLQLSVQSVNINSETFSDAATAYISFSFSNANGNFYYNPNYGNELEQNYSSYDLYFVNDDAITDLSNFSVTIPTDERGQLLQGIYHIDVHLLSNYDPATDSVVATYSNYYKYSFESKKGNLILMGGNNQSIICYDINNIFSPINNNFVFATFTQSNIGDVRSIERKKDSPDVYVSGDKIYNFNIGSFNKFLDRTTNESYGFISTLQDIYANKITTSTSSIYLTGNNSIFKKLEIEKDTSFNDLDPSFNDRIKSRFLILDYDIGSKLNFFDDNGVYRLPDSVNFDNANFTVNGTTFLISSLPNELSWIDYFKDSEKTFKLGSSFQDFNAVKFSSEFSYTSNPTNYTITSNKIGIQSTNKSTRLDIFKRNVFTSTYWIIPGIDNSSSSEFIYYGGLPPSLDTPYDLLLHKNIAVFKRSFKITNPIERSKVENFNLGDVLYLTSDIVDAKLMINRIEYYVLNNGDTVLQKLPSLLESKPSDSELFQYERIDIYLYTISNFNENIINNLSKTTSTISVKNLNHYNTIDSLVSNLDSHPIGIGYKLSKSSTTTTLSCLFNEKTAYYNLQSEISVGGVTKQMEYKESFLNFGYSPTYNIYSYLNKIDPNVFYADKEFQIMPYLDTLPGNAGQGFTNSNIYIDAGSQSNILLFGTDLELKWKGLLNETFIDLFATSVSNQLYSFERILITDKYYIPDLNAYAVEFNTKLTIDESIKTFSLVSRRKLSQISSDLQLLNNIQRSQTKKILDGGNKSKGESVIEFTNLENDVKTKFSTDSYLKVLVSDYDIRQNLSAILYTDREFQISMNILNLESILTYDILVPQPREIEPGVFKLSFSVNGLQNKLKTGDLIYVDFEDVYDSPMTGLQTVLRSANNFVITATDYIENTGLGPGKMTFIKKDPFFNYQPVDIFRHGSDGKVTRSVEVQPTNYELNGTKFSLVDIDLNKFKLQLIDGLSLEELNRSYHWVLEAEVSDALIGKDENGIIWYSGIWRCGRWFGGTWMSGQWLTGDWYGGSWNSFNVLNKVISAKVDNSYSNPKLSKWYNGRWFEGTWNDGTWYNGRRYSGDWNAGIWYNGVWNDGKWKKGFFYGGIWVNGTWENGIFNCDSKPAYWLDGSFKAGDFENGMWYNGLFGNDQKIQTRFGTKASNTRTATWHGGKWLDGEFHSFLNLDENGNPTVSDLHKFSIWKTGIWNRGNWYGGIAFNIDFRGGTWHGGILEEIQVIGIDSISPATYSTNKIYINGIFKFNPGDEIWVIDDYRNLPFSPLGSNDNPNKYRINQIVEDTATDSTGLFLNYNLSTLGVLEPYASKTYSVAQNPNLDLGLRVVSKFTDVTWRSGLWTNGIFTGGKYDSGIWYNGIFDGTWGN